MASFEEGTILDQQQQKKSKFVYEWNWLFCNACKYLPLCNDLELIKNIFIRQTVFSKAPNKGGVLTQWPAPHHFY